MLSTAQAEGYGGGEGSGSVLEEYLDSIMVMPVEVRRYISLMRELDGKTEKDREELKRLQDMFVVEAQKRTKDMKTEAERSRVVEKMKKEGEFAKIEALRKSLNQKIAEKRSVAGQLFDMSEQNLKRLRGDIKFLESLLNTTGEMPDLGITEGREVALWCEKDSTYILGKIVIVNPFNPRRITVADIEDDNVRFQVDPDKVVLLPEDENLNAAKSRLPSRGRKVLAIYPNTTAFYRGTLCTIPYRESGDNKRNVANLAPSNHPPGSILATVQFDDDEVDAVTGVTMKHAIMAKYVFIPVHSF